MNKRKTLRLEATKHITLENACIETLDFSDNDLSDEHGQVILALIKSTSEKRDD